MSKIDEYPAELYTREHMSQLAEEYWDLLEKTLTGIILEDPSDEHWGKGFVADVRISGRDWPKKAHTMIGYYRLRNIRNCILRILEQSVPGDFIETGVWRGGAVIYMAAILKSLGITDRKVWVADSFEGLPPADERYKEDINAPVNNLYKIDFLKVPLEEVKENFSKYNVLNKQIVFLKGFFKDTLPTAEIDKIALLRLDGDMYSSTMDALVNLYHKVSSGGFIIIDDYGAIPECKKAVDEFIIKNDITEPLENIDNVGYFWRKK